MKNYLKLVFLLTLSFPIGAAAFGWVDFEDYAEAMRFNRGEERCYISPSRSWKSIDIKGDLAVSKDGRDKLIEFFSYACKHCYANDKVMGQIYKDIEAEKSLDVFHIPISYNAIMVEAAKLYEALMKNGLNSMHLHRNIFSAFHDHKKPIFSDRAALAVFLYSQLNDVPLVSKIISEMDSEMIKNEMRVNKMYETSYGIEELPSVVIDSAVGVDVIIVWGGINRDEFEMYQSIERFIPKKCRAALKK